MAKINVITNGEFEEALFNLGFQGIKKYSTPVDDYFDHPYFEIWEVSNNDLFKIEEYCLENQIFMYHARGANRGTAYDFLKIHGNSIIAWKENLNTETFNSLTEYFQALNIKDEKEIADYSVYLAKTNGINIVQFWTMYEGN